MDQLPAFGRGIEEVVPPTFAAYEGLLRAREAEIRGARRETHRYGPDARHVLDVYLPSPNPSPPKEGERGRRTTVLMFLHGGGFHSGGRVNEAYAGGLVLGNVGAFFAARGVAVVVPDYRLLAHGARYPSGGEDVALAVAWVRDELAASLSSARGGDVVDLVLLGNSAGGVHVATFLLDPAFGAAVTEAEAAAAGPSPTGDGGVRVRLAGAVFLGTPFHFGDVDDEAINAYLGAAAVSENAPLGRLRAAVRRGAQLPKIRMLALVSELDPPLLAETAAEFGREWPAGEGASFEVRVLEGHNHISPQLSLGTGIEREEAWGVQVAEFLRSCASG